MDYVGDRYIIYDEIASGGMATVYLGRLLGAAGFSRTIAVKRLHPYHAKDPDVVSMLVDEARIVGYIRHPNVAQTLDVVYADGQLSVILEYIEGETLARLMRAVRERESRVPLPIVSAVMSGVLLGLHAAHEARGAGGVALDIVHRDVSPQNVIVGSDGIPRVLDFGIAKAAQRIQKTSAGRIKGKFSYMAPEQLKDRLIDRRTDVFAASIVLWEMLTGRRLFRGANPGEVIHLILSGKAYPPSLHRGDVVPELDALLRRGLQLDIEHRFASARDMAGALTTIVNPAPADQVGDWVRSYAADALSARARQVARIESVEHPPDLSFVHGGKPKLEILPSTVPIHPPTPAIDDTPSSASLPPPRSERRDDDTITTPMHVHEMRQAKRRRRWRVGLALAAVGASAAIASAVVVIVSRAPDPTASNAPVALPPPSPPMALSAAPEPASTGTAGPGPSDNTSEPSRVETRRPSSRARSGSAESKPTASPSRAGSCDPPYTVENGIQVIKKHCL